MKYKSESDMYPDVHQWLEGFLRDRFRQAKVDVYGLPHTPISRFLSTYNRAVAAFLESGSQCKNTKLTLAHLSQLLGYSRIACPLYSFLLSPIGFSTSLVSLLQEYQRRDVLEYHWEPGKIPRQVIVAEWEMATSNLNRHTMIGGAGL